MLLAEVDDRFTYTAVVCPNTTVPAYLRDWFVAGVGAGNDPTRVRTINMDVATNWGFNYNYAVYARCESPYTVSGPSPGATTGWQTPIPAASGLSLSVPSSRQVGYSFTVSLGASCPAATSPLYQVAPNGGQVTGSFTTSHSTIGTKYYSGTVVCYSPYSGRTGPSIGPVYDSIYIYPPPVPAAPASMSGILAKAGSGGGNVTITFSASAGATSYVISGKINTVGNLGSWDDSAVSSAGTYIATQNCTTAQVQSGGVRVRALNSSGSSVFNSSEGFLPSRVAIACN